MTDKIKFELICDLTTDIVGLHKGALSNKTRKQTIHIPRMVASVVARLINDIHPTIIADVLERDRTSVLHYEKSHKHNYASFPKYRDIFNLIYNSYILIQKSKKLFHNNDSLRMFLVKSGIKITSKKPQVKIKVKSGKAKYIVYTNYFDFSNNVDIIKDVLKDYEYSIEIITV